MKYDGYQAVCEGLLGSSGIKGAMATVKKGYQQGGVRGVFSRVGKSRAASGFRQDLQKSGYAKGSPARQFIRKRVAQGHEVFLPGSQQFSGAMA